MLGTELVKFANKLLTSSLQPPFKLLTSFVSRIIVVEHRTYVLSHLFRFSVNGYFIFSRAYVAWYGTLQVWLTSCLQVAYKLLTSCITNL
jgi:hypothetical protein